MHAIRLEDVWKIINDREIIRGVSFNVRPGEVYGLVGPNGAGKTTTLRIVVGLYKPTRGTAKVYDVDPYRERSRLRGLLAYLPEDAGVYERLTGYEHLYYFAWLHTGDKGKAEELAKRGAEISGLGDALKRQAGGYSKGMKRRLLISAVFMLEPQVVVLDEPTSGLDVYSAVKIREVIKEYAKRNNAAVLLSSHNMLEVQYVCDRVAFMSEGRIVEEDTPESIIDKYSAKNLEEAFIMATRGG